MAAAKRILCIGGGPAGLYFALLAKKADPTRTVRVVERNRPYDTFGWGVVFSDQTLGNLEAADPETAHQIVGAFNRWDDIDIHFRGRTIRSGGHGFCGIGRKRLLNILQARCEALGVELVFERQVADDVAEAEAFRADLVIASDGINSRIRERYAASYAPDVDLRACRFVWLGTKKRFDAFTFAFVETPHGWFQAHAYRFDDDTSTFIVETPESTWRAAGLEAMSQEDGIAYCEKLFAPWLDGHPLMSNAAHLRGSAAWIRFPRVVCGRWVHWVERAGGERSELRGDNPRPVVLMGDAAHTAHFSIGSGTKLAFEDAIALAQAIEAEPDLRRALDAYEVSRGVEVLKIQNAARNSTEWFENVKRYTALEAEQFAYSLLTRSQRISHENLRLRDRGYVGGVEAWFAGRTGVSARPPMFAPFTLRGVTLANRVVVSPMAQYSCVDGMPDDYYLVHLGSRAHGGAGLVFTEMACVAPDARISEGCAGLWNDAQAAAWKRIVDYAHARTPAKVALQLGHAGPKGSTQKGWEDADQPIVPASRNWPLIAPSAVAYGPENQVPRAMTREDMDRVLEAFVAATRRGAQAGFDWLELHCAHGYLLSAFLCPLTNLRADEYGGPLGNRCRYPLEVFRAMRAAWPADRPMSVRLSAHDWAPGGNTPDDAVEMARLFREAGADLIDVSSGQTTRDAKPVYGRMYQTPFADRIRNEVGIATMAVGAIFEPDHVNSILMAGRADLCAIARPHLADPYWTLHAAAQLGYPDVHWPVQYLAGKAQLERNLARAAVDAANRPEANG
ncbi:MAG: bifunctional salicylyl-CoA 5-hydroxylase/oxidoreductase [Betaproteobacteria bacterium PRO3]|nr:bifunctional salicylyl-CoA 5-hydroxylase/oxidoreductase [Betaproteobacteria bacterium PRO3]